MPVTALIERPAKTINTKQVYRKTFFSICNEKKQRKQFIFDRACSYIESVLLYRTKVTFFLSFSNRIRNKRKRKKTEMSSGQSPKNISRKKITGTEARFLVWTRINYDTTEGEIENISTERRQTTKESGRKN